MVKVWKVITNHSACRLCLYAPLPVLLSLIWLPIWRGKTGEAEHIFDRRKTDMQVKINAPEWSLSPEALPVHWTSVYVCVRVWGKGKGEVEDQITATLISTLGHDKRVRERFHKDVFFFFFPQWRTWHPCPQIKDKLWRPRGKDHQCLWSYRRIINAASPQTMTTVKLQNEYIKSPG